MLVEKIKKVIKPENLLIYFVIICPILDIASFLFRNKFKTNYSISTFIRPIIPTIVFIYIFFKKNVKLKTIGIIVLYIMYAVIHLFLYKQMIMQCTYGTVIHEAQYIVNYTFMIINLYIFSRLFNNKEKLHKAIIISTFIYIFSIYLAILTGTSSTTYIEGIGYKGWFESGNSISAILILSIFIILSFVNKIQNKYVRGIIFSVLMLVGIYLVILIGTRAGLIGFILAILSYVIAQIFEKVVKKVKINKRTFIIFLSIMLLLSIVVVSVGSITIKRRKHLQNMEKTIIDETTGEVSHLTGDLTIIRNKIVNNEIEEGFMTEAQKKSILDLYDLANKYNISNTNTRIQQLIYHVMLIKNQKNIILILCGNGYLINTNELVWEMEFPAILLNFGICGFILYMIPFICILKSAIIILIKKFKKIDTEFIMLFLGAILSFVLSTLSGYTFFNSSSMIIIIIVNILLKIKINELKEELDCKK